MQKTKKENRNRIFFFLNVLRMYKASMFPLYGFAILKRVCVCFWAEVTDLIRPPRADRPWSFAGRGPAPATWKSNTWSAASTSWTAKVSKVDVQLGCDVIGWLPEVMKIVQLRKESIQSKFSLVYVSAN